MLNATNVIGGAETSARQNIVNPDGAESDERWFQQWRDKELRRLAAADTVYLDYTGAALYAESLVRADTDRLLGAVLGNPHSESGPSRSATTDVEAARRAILEFVNADPAEYVAILTANASASCRLVGEAFTFGPDAPFVLGADNHNSVNGIREFAKRRGAAVHVIPIDDDLRLVAPSEAIAKYRGKGKGLFAFTAQSNFSGVRHPLGLVQEARALGYRTLLDAAAFVPTNTLDLSVVHADFVAISLYKIAGYPSGVGALVARREALDELQRPWFAGGTVDWVTVGTERSRLRSGPERFEDGTPSFVAAGAVADALAHVVAADRARLARHLKALTGRLLEELQSSLHSNDAPLVAIHGPRDTRDRGATVSMTLYDAQGAVIPFWEVEQRARESGIALRCGCFCNPGCAERAFRLNTTDDCLDELGDDFTVPKFAACLGGQPVGAVRVSLGLGSVLSDVERAVGFLRGYLS